MLRKLSAVLVIALAFGVASSARADAGDEAAAAPEGDAAASVSEAAADDDEPIYDRDGWYAGIGAGVAIETFEHGSADDSGFVQVRAGYHFLRFASLDAQLEYTPKFKGGSGRYAGVDTATFGVLGNIKGYPTAPWTGRFQPFGMIGLGWWWERQWGSAVNGVDQDGGFVARFGGGLDVYVTRNVVLTAEAAYVLPTGHIGALNQVQIGGAVQYRFDP